MMQLDYGNTQMTNIWNQHLLEYIYSALRTLSHLLNHRKQKLFFAPKLPFKLSIITTQISFTQRQEFSNQA